MTGTDVALTVAVLSSLVVATAIVVAIANELTRAWRFRQVRRLMKQQEAEWERRTVRRVR